jgi:predicted Zn-dependent protease
MKNFFSSTLLLALAFCFSTCAKNPVTGKKQLVLMSEAQEIAMGQEADPQIIAQYGLYEDSSLQRFITEKGKAMGAISHRPNLDYYFRVVDSDVLNAFAVPGGYVYFTRGIMAHFNNEAEFAGVLGHEIGHITARHTVQQQTRQMLGSIGLIAGIIIKPELGRFAEQASQGLGLLFLKYGRDAERQSDQLGVEYSTKIRYDARYMAGFFNTLKRQSEASGQEELPDFLSTHPNPDDRNVAVDQAAKEWQQKTSLTNPVVNRDSYLRRIEGLIYGEDPRQGFLENWVFYHPQMKFQFNVPQNWKYQNTPLRVQMAPADGQALMYLSGGAAKSLQEAGQAFLEQNGLQLVDQRQITVGGYQTLAIVADTKPDPQQQQAPLRAQAYFYQFGNEILMMMGVSAAQTFSQYQSAFTNTMQSFRTLTDASKINKKPQRVRIKTVATTGTLQQAFTYFKVPSTRMEEFAILNGKLLTEQVTKGTLIKVIEY